MPTSPTPADRPADQLRAAAEKLREEAARAHRASPGPWTVTDEHVVRCADGMIVADRSDTDHPAERADLPYIALMHPVVGLAVADWLKDSATRHLPDTECGYCIPSRNRLNLPCPALVVARQLLGTSAAEANRRCVCGDPIEWMTHPGGPGWIHSPGADTRCLDARPAAAPPAPADRAAALREAADIAESLREFNSPSLARNAAQVSENVGILRVADHLRRLAGEAAAGVQQTTTTEAHPPSVEYIAEVQELDGAWEYLGAHADPAVAVRRRASVTRRHPDAETRTVRKTTTYTVEPEPAAPAAPEEPTR
ncbi:MULTISPECIES: hypothetical protein [unclassified Streptomyces]|uniref:hypothetical protein n=1 Tax=unclassified Streptomyces TaxID=2593676 RepID=UPI0004C583AF|nr:MULTISPECIES: hypothetical protein [unclassified Streptomyces]